MRSRMMQKVIMPVSDCLPGMVVRQPIIDIETGNIILARNSRLTKEILDKIKRFRHTEIWVEIPREESRWNISKETLKKYREYADALEKVFGKFKKDTQIAVKEIKELATSILENLKYDYEFLGCVNLMQNLHKDIYIHSMNVTFLAVLIARWCELPKESLEQVILAGLLHDIGKLNFPERLLHFREDFSVEELLEYKKHPIYGYEKIKDFEEIDEEISKAVLAHHERCDGSGYPFHLTIQDMSAITRILAIADRYETLRHTHHIFNLIKVLKAESLKQFDISITTRFCENVINYYIGAYVKLSTSQEAEVIFIHPHCLHRPIVKVGDTYIDLYNYPDVQIEEVL